MIRIATVMPVWVRSSLAFLNLVFSYPARTKAFTTRMATRFSCTVLFRLSSFSCISPKSLLLSFITMPMPTISTGMATSSTRASSALMEKAIKRAPVSMVMTRTTIRVAMVRVIWIWLTSLVVRVIREAEENRSMSAKEKSCIFWNMAFLRLLPNPCPPLVATRAERTPVIMPITASTSI